MTDPAPRPLRLLLVEDSREYRMLLTLYLRPTGHETVVAEDGLQALEAVRERTFDLILMDMLMPVMDGLDAVRAIRKLEADLGRPPTRIVVLTGGVGPDDRDVCRQVGCDGYLQKPVARADLMALLDELSGRIAP